MNEKKIAVIGAGAAGCVAAGFAAKNGHKVYLFERNQRIARKVLVTGKGRCNLTNHCDRDVFLANVPQNSRFLYSAIAAFDASEVMSFFEALHLPLKVERGNRVFPVSDKAMDVVDALNRFLKGQGVSHTSDMVIEILTDNGAVCGVKTESGKTVAVDAVILATGGCSYSATGSDGNGYALAEQLGHHIVSPRASLVPLVGDESLCRSLQGLSLKNVRLHVLEDGKEIFQDFGELLFTHFGISGPLVLSGSAHMRHFDTKKYELRIDLKPALDRATLDRRLLSDFAAEQNKDFANALGALLPRKIIAAVIAKSGITPDTKVHSITKKQRESLINTLKGFSLTMTGTRPIDEAIVTSGGIETREVSPKTMESKLVSGLFFAGEILDVDAYTGGFNLQIAWSTGYLAGNHV